MPSIISRSGKPLKSRSGFMKRTHGGEGPNDKNFGTIAVRIVQTRGGNFDEWQLQVSQVPAGVDAVQLVLTYKTAEGTLVTDITPAVALTANNWLGLGAVKDDFDPQGQSLVVSVQPLANKIAGRATKVREAITIVPAPEEVDPPSFIALPQFTSILLADTSFTYTIGTLQNISESTQQTVTFEQADDASGTNKLTVTITADTTPGDAGNKYLRIRNEVTDDSLDTPLIGVSPWTFVAAAALDVALGAAPALTSVIEGYVPVKTDGTVVNATNDTLVTITYQHNDTAVEPGAATLTLSSGKIPTTNTKDFVRVKREVTDPSLGAALVDYSTWVAVTRLPSFANTPTWVSATLVEGGTFSKSDPNLLNDTDDTTVVISYQQNSLAQESGAVELLVAGTTLPTTVDNYARIVATMTDPLLSGAGISSRVVVSDWKAVENIEAPAPSIPVPTFGVTIVAYSGTVNYYRPQVTAFSNDDPAYEYQWTTSLATPIPESQCELLEKSGANWITQMTDPVKRVSPNTQTPATRTDYSVFGFSGTGPYTATEPTRCAALRFRRRKNLGGGSYSPWSELSPAYTVPTPVTTGSSTDWPKRFIPVVTRSKEEYNAKSKGGAGKQFLRSYATSPARPDFILAGMDANMQWASDDAAETWYTPSWLGMYHGRQTQAVWMDPENADRQIVVTTGDSRTTKNGGMFLSTDGGKTCSLAMPEFDYIRGTNVKRHNYQSICHKPGKTAATRDVFFLLGTATSGSNNIAALQLYRSQSGGSVGTWAARGSALSVATFCNNAYEPYEIAFRPDGTLMHMIGPKGAWWSDDDGLTWTKCTGLPSGDIHHIEYQSNSKAFVGTNSGLYTSTNGKTFTQLASFGNVNKNNNTMRTVAAGGAPTILYFGISPADSNYIVAAQTTYKHPIYSTDGGTSWACGTLNIRLGEEYVGATSLGPEDHGGIVGFASSREKWFFMSNQYISISRDHGQTTYHGGFYYDGRHTRGTIGFDPDPARWDRWAMGNQDAVSVMTNNGGLYFNEDQFGQPSTTWTETVKDATDSSYAAGTGIYLAKSGTRAVFNAGKSPGPRVAVLEDFSGNPLTIGDPLIKTAIKSSISDFGFIDLNDLTRGWAGQYRQNNLNAAAKSDVTYTNINHFVAAMSAKTGATVIYGVDGSGAVIFRSTNGGDSWTNWVTASRSFRPVDSRPWICADPNHASRLYAVSGAGYAVRFVGNPNSPSETTIFNIRNYVNDGRSDFQLRSIVVDPFDPDLGYITVHMWGCKSVFRCRNLTTTTGATADWESIATDDNDGCPHVSLEANIHPHTSELFVHESHGMYVCKPPAGHATKYGITHSVWDTLNEYLKTTQ